MKSASDLSEEQKQTAHTWADEGAGLQEIQRRLAEEFGLSFTFMETRFLAGDLDLKIKSEPKEEPKKEEAEDSDPEPEQGQEPDSDIPADPNAPPAPAVTVDQITTPGTIISGKVTFSGGNGASWAIDQLGRLSLDPDDPEYRPSQEEVVAFQSKLQEVARKQGL